jgi:hypothetical protein
MMLKGAITPPMPLRFSIFFYAIGLFSSMPERRYTSCHASFCRFTPPLPMISTLISLFAAARY